MSRIVIVGGGAAGMYAALIGAEKGHQIDLYEKNEKLGKKLYITGKGRCNLTNACDRETLLGSVISNPRFMYSSFYGHGNQDTMALFERIGLSIKTERGNRVFPASDKSSDVIKALERELKKNQVRIHLNTEIREIVVKEGRCVGIRTAGGENVPADACILATGGLSYRTTGSTGDGYRFAKAQGHSIVECIPSLVSLETEEDWPAKVQGLSLKNAELLVQKKNRILYRETGEMLFTDRGVSGPLILTASSVAGRDIMQKEVELLIDLKPALTHKQLDKRLIREFEEQKNRQFKNCLGNLFPNKLIPVMVEQSGIAPEKQVNLITKEERKRFAEQIKALCLHVKQLGGFKEAVITKGGVSTREVDPKTMESKLVEGLYFAGEILDVDAVTGGFNLQIAWSTAYAAASHMK